MKLLYMIKEMKETLEDKVIIMFQKNKKHQYFMK